MQRSPRFRKTLHVCVRAVLALCFTTIIASTAFAQAPLDLPLSATQIRSLGQQTFELAATGGTPPYAYSKTPGTANVTGLRIQTGPPFPTNFSASATGALLAVFATPGEYQFSVRVTDSVGAIFDKVITISIADFQIASQTNPPRPTLGVPYQFDLQTVGLQGVAGWSVSLGSPLPPGLNFDAGTARISGTPTSAGNFNSLISLSDQGQAGNAGLGRGIFFNFVVNPYAITTNGQLADATNNVFYTQTIQAPGCGAPCTFTSTNGLPAGLSLNSSTGVLSGTPTGSTNAQAINVSVTGTNGTSLKTFSIRIGFNGIQPVRIDTGPLLQSVVGGTASFALVAGGGTQPYTWEIVEGDTALPEGISIVEPGETISNNALPGYTLLAGRTMSPGQHVFNIKATDAHGLESTKQITWNVTRVAHSFFNFPSGGTSPLLPPVYNQAYTQTLLGLGGTRPYTWTATTPMPGGLALNSSTGVVSGTPTFTGTASVTVELRDAAGEFNSINLNFTATGPTATTLNFGLAVNQFLTQGQFFNQSLGVSGGTGPYTITVDAGSSLPPGFALLSGATSTAQDGSVVLAGTAIKAGVFSTAIRATDSLGNVGVRTFVFTISPMTIFTNALKVGAVGVPYDDKILVAGGTAPVTVSLAPGFALPAGLMMNAAGRITGTPTETASYNINVIATDSTGATTPSRGLTLTISSISFAGVSVTDADSLPPVTIGKPYNFAFHATGGTPPITFSSSFVPGGLTLSSDGVISGTVTDPGWEGMYFVSVSASDGNSLVQRRFAMYIVPKIQDIPSLSVSPATLPDLVVGQALITPIFLGTPTGGKGPFTWSVATGSTLPPGMQLIAGTRLPANFSPDTTLLGGAPTAAGNFTFDLVATDANGTAMARTYRLHVSTISLLSPSSLLNTQTRNPRIGEAFSFQLTTVGGTAPYHYSVGTAGFNRALPPGVTLSDDGLFSGTPTSTGSYTARVTVTDSALSHNTFTRSITFSVFDFVNGGAGGLMVNTGNMPDNSVGIAVSQFFSLSRSSGSPPAPVNWSKASGDLPPGMDFVVCCGGTYLYGAPTAPGTYVYTIRGTNAANPAEFAEREFTYVVAPMQVVSPPVSFFQNELPSAEVGVPYQSQIKLAGGTRPYTFAVPPTVPLPKGLTLSPSGVLSGITDQVGNFVIAFIVTDSSSPTPATYAVSEVNLTVKPAGATLPLVSTGDSGDLLPGTVGQEFNAGGLLSLDFFVRGGVRPFTWTVSSGSTLPPGIALIPGNSAISANLGGKPTTAGDYAFSLDVVDAAGQKLTLPFTLTIGDLGATPARFPNGVVGTPYPATQLTGSGGTPPYSFSTQIGLFEGSGMPPGLTLSSSGLLSGTPTSPGNFAIPVVLQDNAGTFFYNIYRVTIDNSAGNAKAVSVSPTTFEINHVQGAPGAPIPLNINITNGAPPFTASITGIPGATLSANSGTTPTQITMDLNLAGLAEGTYHGQVAVNVPNAANLFDTASITINVAPPPTVNAISVTPDSGSGVARGFTLAYSDSVGVTSDLSVAQVRFTNIASGLTCAVHYRATTDEVRMQDDAGVWGTWVHFGSGSLANSRCSLNLATSSATPSGHDLSMALDMAFTGVFSGPARIDMRARSLAGPDTGWVLNKGTFTVGPDLGAISVTPNSGTGMSGTFTAAFSDSLGVTTDLKSAQVRFGATNVSGCVVQYNAITNKVRLLDDGGNAQPFVSFGTGSQSNSQCVLDLTQSSAAPSGNDLTLTLRLAFKAAFLGADKPVQLRANSNFGTATTGFVTRGTWTVGATVSAVSISPINGSGFLTQDFVLTYSDSEGVTNDLKGAKVRFIATTARCVVDYNAMTGMIRMQDDAGVWGTFKALGSGVLNDSSKCSIDLALSSATPNGTDLTLSLHITFSSTFTANVAMRADSNAIGNAVAWSDKGTWTVSTP